MIFFLLYVSLCDNCLLSFQAFCRGLVILRNKDVLAPTDLLSLFFTLLRCQDKNLRSFLESHLVSDIKNINAKHKNVKLNSVSIIENNLIYKRFNLIDTKHNMEKSAYI